MPARSNGLLDGPPDTSEPHVLGISLEDCLLHRLVPRIPHHLPQVVTMKEVERLFGVVMADRQTAHILRVASHPRVQGDPLHDPCATNCLGRSVHAVRLTLTLSGARSASVEA